MHYLLLIQLLVCYARVIQTILTNPGFLPRGPLYYRAQKNSPTDRKPRHARFRDPRIRHHAEKVGDQESISPSENSKYGAPLGADGHSDFWLRDMFVCNYDGRPNWCSTCMNFKTDRTHHCREVDRCVAKFDHYCPWAGGLISETSFKYFIQFVTYAAFFCLYLLIVFAVFVHERNRTLHDLNVHWCIILGLSALFFLFSAGMSGSSLQLAIINSTTVENLSRRSKTWYVAVRIPRSQEARPVGNQQALMTITYPRPLGEQQLLQDRYVALSAPVPDPNTGTPKHGPDSREAHEPRSPADQSPTSPSTGLPPPTHQTEQHLFAILASQPGENPFDLGPLANLKEVLGYRYRDWILPIKPSPCADHSSGVSLFKMGEVVRRMKEDAGLEEAHANRKHRRHRRRRGRRESNASAQRHSNDGSSGATRGHRPRLSRGSNT